MPLTRLMSKLSKRDCANSRGESDTGPAGMDYDRSTSYINTTEAVHRLQGQRSIGVCSSSLSTASSVDAGPDMSSSMPAEHRLWSHTFRAANPSSLMSGALPGSSAAAAAAGVRSASSCTASLRVMRAKGKAALRGQTLGSNDQHCSLDQRTSLEHQQGGAFFTVGSSSSSSISAHSLPYQRAATDPVSLWVATGSTTNSKKSTQLGDSGVIPDADVDVPLASPLSPGAAGAPDADPHCEWEDGVVAGWLDGVDLSELVHDEDELQQMKQLPQVQTNQHSWQQLQQQQQQRSLGLPRAECTGSKACVAAPEVVFSSLLYS